ncbi:MAG: DinB family protein [Candidatus Limnocylindria bacterium]
MTDAPPVQLERSPDPVAEPKAYQDMLVGLVGSDDPAAVQAATPDLIRNMVAAAGDDLGTRPEPREWSVLECVAHILDAEIVVSGRYRWILAHDQPELIGYDQDLWVDRLHQPPEGPDELLALLEPLRRANLALWARTSDEGRQRFGLHRERGPETYALTFTLIAGHDRFHLAQAGRALGQVRAHRDAETGS